MRPSFFSKASSVRFAFNDKLSIQISDDGILHVQSENETLMLDENNKPVFHNTSGESVVEYTGLSTDGNKERSWAKAVYQPGGFSQLHYHNERTEHYYIVAGRAQITLNDVMHELSAGDTIAILAGARHQVQNITADHGQLVLVVKCEPAWIADDVHFFDTSCAVSMRT